jgi:hypothetical protein
MKRGKQVKGITERRRADGTIVYEVVGRLGKKVKRIGTYLSRTEAVAAEQERQVNQRKINRGEMSADYSSRRTMDQAASDWLGSLARGRSRSHSTYERVWRLQLRDRIGGSTKVAAVREADVMRVRDDLAVHYAPATVKGALTCLSAAFTYFKKRGWVISNPCHGVRSVENPERAYNWIETHAEVARLLAACGPTLLPSRCSRACASTRSFICSGLTWTCPDESSRCTAVARAQPSRAGCGASRSLTRCCPCCASGVCRVAGRRWCSRARHRIRCGVAPTAICPCAASKGLASCSSARCAARSLTRRCGSTTCAIRLRRTG